MTHFCPTRRSSDLGDGQGLATVDFPGARWVTSPNYSSRSGTAVRDVAIHTMQGSYAGSISWFQNSSSQVSAHYLIRSSDGQVTQMVREYNKAWHVRSHNTHTIGRAWVRERGGPYVWT